MVFLVRTISAPTWCKKHPGLGEAEVAADVVTREMKTEGNSLSFWRFEASEDQFPEEAALAYFAAPGKNCLEKTDVVWVASETLESDGLALRPQPGITGVADLKDRHVNVALLDGFRLAKLASHIATAVRQLHTKPLTKLRVLHLLGAAVREKRLQLEDLHENVRKHVERELESGAGQ